MAEGHTEVDGTMTRPQPTRKQRREADYTVCRTFGHSWDHIGTDVTDRGDDVIGLRCTRCAMLRHDIVDDRTGDLIRRGYTPPAGYRETEKMTRSEWRTRFLRSILK